MSFAQHKVLTKGHCYKTNKEEEAEVVERIRQGEVPNFHRDR